MDKFKQTLKDWFIPGTENDHKPHILRNKMLLAFAVFVLCLKLLVLSFFFYFPNSAYFSVITGNRLVELMNQSRVENGLSPLVVNDKLNESAYLKAQDILEKNYFAHTSPQGISPWYWLKQANYSYHYAGENLAIDFTDAESLYKAWLDSPSHRANILNPEYKEVGIIALTGDFNGRKTTIAVQHFGTLFEKPGQIVEKPIPVPPAFAELETKTLASSRETQEEPVLTPQEKQIEDNSLAVIQEKINDFEKFANDIQTRQGPKILGALAEKSDQITKEISLFALIFIILALFLNVFIKIKVQRRGLIVNGLILIILILLLILIGDKSLLNIGLGIL